MRRNVVKAASDAAIVALEAVVRGRPEFSVRIIASCGGHLMPRICAHRVNDVISRRE